MTQSSTETYRPKDGDVVEVVLRGPVQLFRGSRDRFRIGHPGEANTVLPGADHVVSVTKYVEPYEPRNGDVVRDAHGDTLFRTAGYWTDSRDSSMDAYAPLTLLVRDGQVVSS